MRAAAAPLLAAAALCACASSPLCKAARRGDLAGLKAASSADDSTKGDALYCAVENGRLDSVRALLAAGAPIGFFTMRRAEDHQPEILALLRQEQSRRDAAKAAAKVGALAAPPAEAPADVDTPSYRQDQRPSDAAIAVGVDGFGPHDAEAVRAHLIALGYPDSRVAALSGPAATRLAVLKALDAKPAGLGEGSAAAFYFSGRGAVSKDGRPYLLLIDSDAGYLEDTALPLERVYQALRSWGASRTLLILEAPFPGGRLPPPPPGVTVLAASDGSAALPLADKRHGSFTYQLLKALSAGKRTAGAVLDYAKPPVAAEAAKLGATQKPVLLGPDAAL